MQGGEVREIEWAPPKEAPPVFVAEENPPEEYGPWQWAAAFGRATGRFGAEDFTLQENGRLRCPAGASLWLSEVRQENAFTRACRLPGLPDRLSALFPAGAVPGERRPKEIGRVGSVRSAVSCLPLPLLSESPSCSDRCAGSMWPVERFAVPGPPTGAGNMWRCFPWLGPSRRPSLLLVHPVPSVRIIAGVGRIGSHATPGGDHRSSVSLSLAFPLFQL
jgi:hypothetical protein